LFLGKYYSNCNRFFPYRIFVFNLTWFAILVAVNLQTAWLSPPVALSAYFLKGVVPEWDLKDIYLGMMQFMVLQVIGLIIIIALS